MSYDVCHVMFAITNQLQLNIKVNGSLQFVSKPLNGFNHVIVIMVDMEQGCNNTKQWSIHKSIYVDLPVFTIIDSGSI